MCFFLWIYFHSVDISMISMIARYFCTNKKKSGFYLYKWCRYPTLKITHFEGPDNLTTRLILFIPDFAQTITKIPYILCDFDKKHLNKNLSILIMFSSRYSKRLVPVHIVTLPHPDSPHQNVQNIISINEPQICKFPPFILYI